MSLIFATIPQKRLLQGITSSDSTFYIDNILSFDGITNVSPSNLGTQHYCAFRNDTGSIIEVMEIDPTTISAGPITIVRRGLSYYGDRTTESASLKFDWPTNTIVMLGTDVPQIFQYLKEYIDAASIAGAVPASTTAAGILVEASQAEVDARTPTKIILGVVYKLFAPLDKLRATKYHDYAADAGSNDTYAITVTPAPTAYATGQIFTFKANTINTGAATLNVNGLGAKSIVKNYNVALDDGDIKANQIVLVEYDGTNFQLLSRKNDGAQIGVISQYAGRAAPAGYLMCDGSAVSRTTYSDLLGIICPSGTFTVTLASPGVFSKIGHGYVAGDKIHFTTTGALPTGLAVNTDYYVISAGLTADTFRVALSPAGSAVNTSGSQSGTQTVYASAYGKGDGSTTFNVPDLRSKIPLGLAATAPTQTLSFEGAQRSSNTITILNTIFPAQGQPVILTTTGALPTGLSLATTYYIIRVSSTSISFASSQANANAGTAIALSGDGSGVNTMTFTNSTHTVLGRQGGEETHAQALTELTGHSHTAVVLGGSGQYFGGPATTAIHSAATDNGNGGDGQHNNMQPFIVINYIIKY